MEEIKLIEKIKALDFSVTSKIDDRTMSLIMPILDLECVTKLGCDKCSPAELSRCFYNHQAPVRNAWGRFLKSEEYKWLGKEYNSKMELLFKSLLEELGIPWKLWHKERKEWVDVISVTGDRAIISAGGKLIESPLSLYDTSIKNEEDLKLKNAQAEKERDKRVKANQLLYSTCKPMKLAIKEKYTITVKRKIKVELPVYCHVFTKRGTHKLYVYKKKSLWLVPTDKLWNLKVAVARKEVLDFLKAEAKLVEEDISSLLGDK
jgi:hypothetical protein